MVEPEEALSFVTNVLKEITVSVFYVGGAYGYAMKFRVSEQSGLLVGDFKPV